MAVSKDMREYLESKKREDLNNIEALIRSQVEMNTEEAIANPTPQIAEALDLVAKAQQSLINLREGHGIKFDWQLNNFIEKGINIERLIVREITHKDTEELYTLLETTKEKYKVLLVQISMTGSAKKINQLLKQAGIELSEVED